MLGAPDGGSQTLGEFLEYQVYLRPHPIELMCVTTCGRDEEDGGGQRSDAARGRLLAHRAGRPELRAGFQADLTPKETLRLGVFGGEYMTDCHGELPKSWFAGATLCAERHDARLNCFGVNASQSLAVWRRSGWIHTQDPRGWFQWYCRYYLGRRSATMCGRFDAGAQSDATWRPFGRTASRAISSAAEDSGRRCSIGRTTAEGYRKDFKSSVVVAGATGFMTAR